MSGKRKIGEIGVIRARDELDALILLADEATKETGNIDPSAPMAGNCCGRGYLQQKSLSDLNPATGQVAVPSTLGQQGRRLLPSLG